MNRNFFLKISVLAVVSLSLLALVQCIWTIKMYSDQKEDFVRRVESAAYKSIYKAFRMDAIPGLQAADMININLDEFALHFTPNLLELDITQTYCADILLGNGNNEENAACNNSKILMSYGTPDTIGEKKYTSTIPIDDDGMFYLRVTIALPYKAFWGRMWGILFSSVLIVLLLSGVLFYLVKTMFRQRTLEQMRQDFTHNITHELKTPISTATAAADALRNFSAEADPKRRSRYLHIIETQLEQLSTMVERILQVSVEGKEEKICKEKMLLFPTVEELANEMQMGTDSLDVQIDCPSSLEIYADPFHFKNVMATVMDNAVKYSTSGNSNEKNDGTVKIKICARYADGNTIIDVSDKGCGIARNHLPHIFEKYYRVPRGDVHQVRGYGLGLHYARNVVELHGGTISAQSRLGYGTTISIELPGV